MGMVLLMTIEAGNVSSLIAALTGSGDDLRIHAAVTLGEIGSPSPAPKYRHQPQRVAWRIVVSGLNRFDCVP